MHLPNNYSLEINIGKHRNGPIGTIKLTFLGELVRFDNFVSEPVKLGTVKVFVVLLKTKVESVPNAEPPSLNWTCVSDPAAPGATPAAAIVIAPSEFVMLILVP